MKAISGIVINPQAKVKLLLRILSIYMPNLVAYFVIFEVMFSIFLLTAAYNDTVGICDHGDHVRTHMDEPKCTPQKIKIRIRIRIFFNLDLTFEMRSN